MKLLIKNGRVIDPSNNRDCISDIAVEDGKIVGIGPSLSYASDETISAEGMWVTPGFVDMHVHLRDPGLTLKEDIASGTRSAAAGGFTTICCMPNTKPVTDCAAVVKQILQKNDLEGVVRVLPIGAMTEGQNGVVLAAMEEMAEAGVCGFSEDGKSVADAGLMKQVMERAKQLELPVFSHCEDLLLVNGGVIHDGEAAARLGLSGISSSSEEVIVARDILLAKETGARLHICHMSTSGSVELLRWAKAMGINVSGEACPHHFALCDEDIVSDDGNYKMNPPLRSACDKDSIKQGLQEDIIEIIATDHAPHHVDEKTGGFAKAISGIVGLETAFGLCMTLVNEGVLTPAKLIEKLTINPAKALGINRGHLAIGAEADITIIDPAAQYRVDPAKFFSKGKNTPFGGCELTGKVCYTIVDGRVVYTHNETKGETKRDH